MPKSLNLKQHLAIITKLYPNLYVQILDRIAPHETDEFLREATRMKMFDHPNVLSLLGISVYEAKPCVLLPLMSHGDLRTYMRNNQEVGKFRILAFIIRSTVYLLSFVQLLCTTFTA